MKTHVEATSRGVYPFVVEFPMTDGALDQDQEWCLVKRGVEESRIRFHDYHKLYDTPGLYEHIFYERLACQSPRVICSMLKDQLESENASAEDLRVLDLGAGNGVVGEELASMGVKSIIGVDILTEAKDATLRDRPHVYQEYLAVDLTDLSAEDDAKLDHEPFNCLTTVAALGYGDIPPRAFARAFNAITAPGWIVFNIKDRFLEDEDPSGFCKLIRRMKEENIIDIQSYRRYRHRLATDGRPLHYIAIVAVKNHDITESMLRSVEGPA